MPQSIEFQKQMLETVYINLPGPTEPTPGMTGSDTQGFYNEWTTFEETFETREGEDSFMLTLRSGIGTFYIKEINIELIQQ